MNMWSVLNSASVTVSLCASTIIDSLENIFINFAKLHIFTDCFGFNYDSRDASLIPGLGRSLEEEMATHFIILAWEIPWIEKSGRLQSMERQRVGHA